jgi:hypothetical protein
MEPTVYDSRTLLGVFWDNNSMEPPENYWLGFYPQTLNFTTETIDFSQLADVRKLAPLVVPTAQGVPIYSAAERLVQVKPAYLKPKDPVTATRMIRRAAGLGELAQAQPLTPQQRYQAIVTDIVRQHRFAIERRWEWMAAKATIDAKVLLEDDRYPRKLVDFQRNAAQTVTLTAGNRWGDAGVSILSNIASWKAIMRRAKFGGIATRLTVGADVWEVMRADPEIREFLDTQFKLGANINLKLGMLEGLEVERVGNIESLEVYVYSDYYQESDGTIVPYMSPKDIVLTSPNIQGVRCFGAIQDLGANLQSLTVFTKMWNEQDPSATFIMSQSAPLMVPINPNASFKATVVA